MATPTPVLESKPGQIAAKTNRPQGRQYPPLRFGLFKPVCHQQAQAIRRLSNRPETRSDADQNDPARIGFSRCGRFSRESYRQATHQSVSTGRPVQPLHGDSAAPAHGRHRPTGTGSPRRCTAAVARVLLAKCAHPPKIGHFVKLAPIAHRRGGLSGLQVHVNVH